MSSSFSAGWMDACIAVDVNDSEIVETDSEVVYVGVVF
jgi:hypothetical protein